MTIERVASERSTNKAISMEQPVTSDVYPTAESPGLFPEEGRTPGSSRMPRQRSADPAKRKSRRRHKIHSRRATAVNPAPAKSEINVTPLVDVVLVLLIIFMVVTPMLHRGVDLELPTTQNHRKRQDTGEQLVVSVRGDGAYVEADRIDIDKLAGVIEKELKSGGRPVNVRADRTLRFGAVRKVLEQVHAAGAPVVNMETQEKKD